MNDLVDSKYFILDTHYKTVKEKQNLNSFQKRNYKKFRDHIDTGDKNLFENIKKDCEILLNRYIFNYILFYFILFYFIIFNYINAPNI